MGLVRASSVLVYWRRRSQGFSSVSLWVLELNLRAIRFYSKADFYVEAGSEKELALGGTNMREVRMVHASSQTW